MRGGRKRKKCKINFRQLVVFSSYNKKNGWDGFDGPNDGELRNQNATTKIVLAYICLFLDTSVVNTWLLMKKILPNDKKFHCFSKFRRDICLSLLNIHETSPRKEKQPNDPNTDIRFDGKNHWIIPVSTEKKLRHCHGKRKFMCQNYDMGLHSKCFKDFHAYYNMKGKNFIVSLTNKHHFSESKYFHLFAQ